jgi:monoamine oxidase
MYRLRPSLKGAIRFLASHSWANNRWVTGNKHIFQPGQVTRFGQQIADPWQRLHFAGEHTRDIEPGMEAAAATGERAAFEILARMGKA